ncbi:hypothetical protein Sjap_015277 [Stephania japonica]|uniref:Uncharacterized protein n=1 Tax=Stephania japonica TaxID=461633 RepID=A0AAP0IJA0_9MAGN
MTDVLSQRHDHYALAKLGATDPRCDEADHSDAGDLSRRQNGLTSTIGEGSLLGMFRRGLGEDDRHSTKKPPQDISHRAHREDWSQVLAVDEVHWILETGSPVRTPNGLGIVGHFTVVLTNDF